MKKLLLLLAVYIAVLFPCSGVISADQVTNPFISTNPFSFGGSGGDGGITVEIDPVYRANLANLVTEAELDALHESILSDINELTIEERDPIYAADKSGTMQLGDVKVAGSLTLGGPPLSNAEATNKAYVDSAIGSASQDLLDEIRDIPNEVTYTTESTLYEQNVYIPHVQSPSGDIALATMMEITTHAQNDQGYWNFLQNVANQVTADQALNTQLQIKVNELVARIAVLENNPTPDPEPVYDMTSGLTLHTPALLGLLGLEIGSIDLIGLGWTAPGDGILVVDGASAIGLLTPVWIAVNGVKADPSGTVVLQLLGNGQSGQIEVREGDIVTQEGMGNITFYKRIS